MCVLFTWHGTGGQVYEVQKPEGSQHVSCDRPDEAEGHHWELWPNGKLARENLWRRIWAVSRVFFSPWTFQVFGGQFWNDNLTAGFRGRWKGKVGMVSHLYCFLSAPVPHLGVTCPKSPPKSCLLNQHALIDFFMSPLTSVLHLTGLGSWKS